MKKILIYTSLLICSRYMYSQGPWAQGKGHGYGQLLFNIIPTYDQLYVGTGDTRTLQREISDITVSTYSEVGISKEITVGINAPLVLVRSGDATSDMTTIPKGSLSSIGNISLFGKYSVIDEKIKVALITQVDLPTADQDDVTGLSSGVDATTFFPKVSVGGSKSNWFAYGFIGYGLRNNNYHDILNFGVEGGLKASDKVTFILNINRWHNLENGDDDVDSLPSLETGLYTSIQEYSAVLIKIFAENLYDNMGGLISIGGGSGTSVAASPAISLGLFYKW